jgi:hypothetical protein
MSEKIRLEANFTLDEFACKCCGGVFMLNYFLPKRLQELRNWLVNQISESIYMKISGPTRCAKHHQEIYEKKGQVPRWSSRHLTGEGVDIQLFDSMTGSIVYWSDEMLEAARGVFQGLGIPDSRRWLHVDLRRVPAEWTYNDEANEEGAT